ncbi:MAG: right-handed parallel beta-helix repeat-containing protein [Candidatus Hodarchaeales archaeon]|jgi:nitrous oxidase accessory protein NosD
MKTNSIFVLFIILGILFIPISKINLDFNEEYLDKISEDSDINDYNTERLKILSVTGKIHIDNNWSDAKIAGICTGLGTFNDPYLIKDFEIDGEGIGTCLWIENTNDYFEIENSTFLNGEVGIKLENTTNGVIRNNTLKNIAGTRGLDNTGQFQSGYNGNDGIGILLQDSSNYSFNNNVFENITGGNGGNGGNGGSGGAGGHGIGIYLSDSRNNQISDSIFTNITGGLKGYQGGSSGNGVDGTGFGIYLEADSYQNSISNDNFYENDPIVFLFNQSNVLIESYSFVNEGIPLNLGQIVLINCTDVVITGNEIVNFNGESGSSGANNAPGETGGNSAGIYLLYSSNITIYDNSIGNITGGIGGTSGRLSYSGNGGKSAGIFLKDTDQSLVYNNTIFSINGGIGGTGGCIGVAGTGGISGGIISENSFDNEIYTNKILDINGGEAGATAYGAKGGTGGIGSGIYFKNSRDNTVSDNSITNISGSNGKSGNAGSSGGEGGIGTGFYFDSSINNNLNNNTLSSITGGEGAPSAGVSAAGADTTGNGIYFNSDSYQNMISLDNYVNGELIIYLYGISNMIINDFILTNTVNPTNLGVISILYCSNLTISNNTLAYHEGQGGISGANYNNGGNGGDGNGIFIHESFDLTITENHIMHVIGGEGGAGGLQRTGGTGGAGNGIYLSNSDNNLISQNLILNMTGGKRGNLPWSGSWGSYGVGRGIFAVSAEQTNISENSLNNCTGVVEGYGIQLDSSTSDVFIFFNSFNHNTINALDDGNNNSWDNGEYGNYWDDHLTPDDDGDGIVDQPYNISGTAENKDLYPLISFDLNAPNVTIISPFSGQSFQTESPSFIVVILDENLDEMWYEIEGIIEIITDNGSIDQVIWNNLDEGLVTIKFFASDLYGHIGESIVVVIKDVILPVITINAPLTGSTFGHFAPRFDIFIDEPDIESMWYTINGGITSIIFTQLTGTIDQALWSALPNGYVVIRFYFEDGWGRILSSDVVVIRNAANYIPSAPLSLSVTPGDNYAIIYWIIPSDNGSSAIIRYNVYRGTISGQYMLLGTTMSTNFTDVTVFGGTMYYYVVTAVNSVGEGIFSSEVSIIPLGSPETPATVPNTPQSLSYTVGANFVHLSWIPPSNDGESAITRYNVYRGTTSGEYIFVGIATTTTNYNDTLVVGGITYFYVVTAINAIGESEFSDEIEANPTGLSVPKSGSFPDFLILLSFLGILVLFTRKIKRN